MKTALALAAALGLSVSAAAAACPGHNATTSLDKDLVVASISTPADPAPAKEDEEAK